jgi:hypothetical protein
MGHTATFLEQLKIIQSESPTAERETRIAVYESSLSESVSSTWSIDQFTLSRSPITVALFLNDTNTQIEYPLAQEPLLSFVEHAMRRQEHYTVEFTGRVSGFSEAFAVARSEGVDYFVLFSLQIDGRSTGIAADLHVARTGARASTFRAVRTGERRTAAAVDSFCADLSAALPRWYHIVARTGRDVVLDVGRRGGVSEGDELLVFASGAVGLSPDSSRLAVDPSQAIGMLTVHRVDDLVSEASLSLPGLLDRVRTGDVAVEPPGEETVVRAGEVLFPLLYERVRRLQ